MTEDEPIPYIPLVMRHDKLLPVPALPLPVGYSIRLFRPGEELAWAEITTDAGEFQSTGEALNYFTEHFAGHFGQLADRCLFLLDGAGKPIGTATGWFMDDDHTIGRLHWVAIAKAHQGRRLCKPLVVAAMNRMAELGHTAGILTTQPESWKGIKVYLHLGWKPFDDGLPEYHRGWSIVESILHQQML